MHECPSPPTAIDIAFRACQEECEYCATFRVNPRALGERTAEYYVDHACVTVRFRGRVPSAEDDARVVALDAIGFDHTFLVSRHGGDEAASYRELARIAMAWWFDEFERDASAITLAVARMVEAVVGGMGEGSGTAPDRRLAWNYIRVPAPP